MADGIGTAIGLAGTAYKLVVFAINFVDSAKDVYRHGGIDQTLDLATVSKSMDNATTALESQLKSSEVELVDLDEQLLRELSHRAAEIGRELAQKLEGVTINEKSKWKSLKAVVSGLWNDEDIRGIEKRLNAVRDQIQFTVIVDLRKKVNDSHDETHSRMLAALERAASHRAESQEDNKRIIQILNQNDKADEVRHEEIINLGNQLLEGIAALSVPVLSTQSSSLPATIQLEDEKARKRANGIVMNTLWYPSIRDREETISEAHKQTFQWIYEDPVVTGKPWDNFAEFLANNAKAYWVSGKPGSGKSTLVKFINENQQTKTLLQQWARGNLLMASFYFFYNGSDNQKTELGLFRSLLYSLLEERQDLIPVAFNDRYQAALDGRRCADPTLAEAKRALKRVLTWDPNLKFFISIDGLDEFDSRVSHTSVASLIDFTHYLEECRNVKLLVSSRPLTQFEYGYRGRPCLRMHDLTENDIRNYATERLMKHERFEKLSQTSPDETATLLQTIATAAMGVFLWVRLVTDSLLDGLTNYETIKELQDRLDALPSDLHDLYKTMLSRVEPRYRAEMARYLYAVRLEEDSSLLDLWFIDRATDSLVFQTKVRALQDEEVRERSEETEIRLKSRCLGLIEVVPITKKENVNSINYTQSGFSYDYSTDYGRLVAKFLHRSVHEFLEQNWEEVLGRYLPYSEVTLRRLQAGILGIKGFRSTPETNWMTLIRLAGVVAVRAWWAAPTSTSFKLMDEFDSAMGELVDMLETFHTARLNDLDTEIGAHWSYWAHYLVKLQSRTPVPLDITHSSLLSFAAQHRLTQYVEWRIKKDGAEVLDKEGMPVMGMALLPPFPFSRLTSNEADTLEMLLKNGCDPNALYNGRSIWAWFLTNKLQDYDTESNSLGITPFARPFNINAIHAMVRGGAAPNAVALWSDPVAKSKTYCTLIVCMRRLHKILSGLGHLENSPEFRGMYYGRSLTDTLGIVHETIIELEAKGAVEKEWENEQMIESDPVEERLSDVTESSESPEDTDSSQPAASTENPRPSQSPDAITGTPPAKVAKRPSIWSSFKAKLHTSRGPRKAAV